MKTIMRTLVSISIGVSCAFGANAQSEPHGSTASQASSIEANMNRLEQRLERQNKRLKKQVKKTEEIKRKLKEEKKQFDNRLAENHGILEKIKSKNDFTISGDAIVEYFYTSFSGDFNRLSKDRGGSIGFNSFTLRAHDEVGGLRFNTEFWLNNNGSYINDTWVGYKFNDEWSTRFGLMRRPFGILPFAYHNFWYDLAYYTGWDDSRQFGLKTHFSSGPWDVQAAFMKNSYHSFSGLRQGSNLTTGSGRGAAGATGGFDNQQNVLNDELDLRLAYTLDKGSEYQTTVGVSGSAGQVYNNTTRDNGSRYGVALHLNGKYGPWGLRLEALNYQYDLENPKGVRNDTVEMSYFGFKYLIPAAGTIYLAEVSREIPFKLGPIKSIKLYDDFSYLSRAGYGSYRLPNSSYQPKDSIEQVFGAQIHAGRLITWIDLIEGRNAGYAFAGPSNGDWHTRVNVSVGFFF